MSPPLSRGQIAYTEIKRKQSKPPLEIPSFMPVKKEKRGVKSGEAREHLDLNFAKKIVKGARGSGVKAPCGTKVKGVPVT